MCSCICPRQDDPGIGAHIELDLEGDLVGGRHHGLECVLDRLGGIAHVDERVIQGLSDLVCQIRGGGGPCACVMSD
jgi:hypothetical protein